MLLRATSGGGRTALGRFVAVRLQPGVRRRLRGRGPRRAFVAPARRRRVLRAAVRVAEAVEDVRRTGKRVGVRLERADGAVDLAALQLVVADLVDEPFGERRVGGAV